MEARLSAPVQTCPGADPASYTVCAVPFSGVKEPERGVNHPPHLLPRLKKEYSYTFTSLTAFVASSRVNFF